MIYLFHFKLYLKGFIAAFNRCIILHWHIINQTTQTSWYEDTQSISVIGYINLTSFLVNNNWQSFKYNDTQLYRVE